MYVSPQQIHTDQATCPVRLINGIWSIHRHRYAFVIGIMNTDAVCVASLRVDLQIVLY